MFTTVRDPPGAIVTLFLSASACAFGSIGLSRIESADYADAISVGGYGDGRGIVTDVDVRGGFGRGIHANGTAIVSRFRYLQGSGTAIFIENGRVDASHIEIDQIDVRSTAIFVHTGTLNLADSTVASDGVAIAFGSGLSNPPPRDGTITNSVLRSKSNGIMATGTHLTVRDSTIEGTSANTGYGISMTGGTLTLTGSVIRGWAVSGIETLWLSTLAGAGASSPARLTSLQDEPLEATNVNLDHVEISACSFGIWYDAGFLDGRFSMHHTRVSAAQGGLMLGNRFAVADLGTAASPGDNQLEVTSGDVALDVRFDVPGLAVDAHGTTLNGVSYEGDVQGPAEVPGGYRVSAPNTIHF